MATKTHQAMAEGPKPVVDYSRVTEIATEAQIRSAAQYLVKKRNCDGDLIPAIEYAIARWGRPTPQPPADGEVGEVGEWLRAFAKAERRDGRLAGAQSLVRAAKFLQRFASPIYLVLDPSPEALASLKSAGPGIIEAMPAERTVLVPAAQPVAVSERLPGAEDCDEQGRCWLGGDQLATGFPTWILGYPAWASRFPGVHYCWLPFNALPLPQGHGI